MSRHHELRVDATRPVTALWALPAALYVDTSDERPEAFASSQVIAATFSRNLAFHVRYLSPVQAGDFYIRGKTYRVVSFPP